MPDEICHERPNQSTQELLGFTCVGRTTLLSDKLCFQTGSFEPFIN